MVLWVLNPVVPTGPTKFLGDIRVSCPESPAKNIQGHFSAKIPKLPCFRPPVVSGRLGDLVVEENLKILQPKEITEGTVVGSVLGMDVELYQDIRRHSQDFQIYQRVERLIVVPDTVPM